MAKEAGWPRCLRDWNFGTAGLRTRVDGTRRPAQNASAFCGWGATFSVRSTLPFLHFGQIGHLAVRLCGFVALWLCGSVDLWICGFLAFWVCDSVALWLCGSVGFSAFWLTGPMAFRPFSFLTFLARALRARRVVTFHGFVPYPCLTKLQVSPIRTLQSLHPRRLHRLQRMSSCTPPPGCFRLTHHYTVSRTTNIRTENDWPSSR